MPIIEKVVDMIWDEEAQERFLSETHSHRCVKELDRPREVIVWDHCRFHGPKHQQCNLDYKIEVEKYKFPIIFQNLRR